MTQRSFARLQAPDEDPEQVIHTLVTPEIDDEVIAASKSEGLEHFHIVRPANMRFMKPFARFFRLKLSRLGFTEVFVTERFIPVIAEVIPNALQHGVPETPVGVNVEICGHAPHRIVLLLVSNLARDEQVQDLAKRTHLSEMGEHLLDQRGRGLSVIQSLVDGSKMLIYRNFSVHVVCFFNEHRSS